MEWDQWGRGDGRVGGGVELVGVGGGGWQG